jgi:hypothetical protein
VTIIVVAFSDNDAKRRVMVAKLKIRDKVERVHKSNMNAIVNAVGRGSLAMRGDRIVETRDNSPYRRSRDWRTDNYSGDRGARGATEYYNELSGVR